MRCRRDKSVQAGGNIAHAKSTPILAAEKEKKAAPDRPLPGRPDQDDTQPAAGSKPVWDQRPSRVVAQGGNAIPRFLRTAHSAATYLDAPTS